MTIYSDEQIAHFESRFNRIRDEWLQRPGVTAVDIGLKWTAGRLTNQVALRVHITRKKSLSELTEDERFPAQLEGMPIDIIEANYVLHAEEEEGPEIKTTADSHTQRYDEIPLGASVGSLHATAGTLGAKVIDIGTDEELILSTWHTFVGAATAEPGVPVFQPGRIDGGGDRDRIATLTRVATAPYDAAVARLTGERPVLTHTIEGEPIVDAIAPQLGMHVWKSGRTTGRTEGMIDGIKISFSIHYPGIGPQILHDVFRVVPLPNAGNVEISSGGDSGAVWVDAESGKAVGLHIAGEVGDAPEQALAHEILPVLRTLRVRLPQQAPDEISVMANFALNDRPVGKDQLGYDAYADAFARILNHKDTKTPLTIGIYASWGMGKSFLMGKIKERMQALQSQRRKPPFIEQIRRWLLRQPRSDDLFDFHFVEFNAWVYSGSDNLWAGLITRLYSEVERHLKWRASYFRLSQSFHRSIAKTIGLLTLYGVLGIIVSLLLDFNAIQESWDTTRLAVNALVGTVVGGSFVAALPALLKALQDLGSSFLFIRARQLAKFSSRPDFQEKIGFMADVKSEISTINKMLRRGKGGRSTRIVIFIDDLDRCPPAKTVEVLEAIMLLLADEDGAPFVVFLGIDARIIVKAIEEWYGKVLVEAGVTGYEYLDKIVQIPFTIPPANEEARRQYVTSLLWRSEEERQKAKQAESTAQQRDSGTAATTEKNSSASSQGHQPAASQTSPDHSPNVRQNEAQELLPKTITEVAFQPAEQEAFEEFAAYLSSNPRRIKRIVNIYRFVRLLRPDAANEERRWLIKWLILSEQWPHRIAWIMKRIENDYQTQSGFSQQPNSPLKLVYEVVREQIEAKETQHLAVLDGDPELFEKFIVIEPILTVAHIQSARLLTFNLNPAVEEEIIQILNRNQLQSQNEAGEFI